MERETSNLLFVYGTLMRGMDNPFSTQLSKASEFLGSATAPGCLYDYQSEYPCAVTSLRPCDVIHGELYHLIDPEPLFLELDPYEDCYPEDEKRSLFTRRIVEITTHEQVEAIWRETEARVYQEFTIQQHKGVTEKSKTVVVK